MGTQPAKNRAHYAIASSPLEGAYSSLVKNDGALFFYQQNAATISLAESGADKVITFRGILAQSTDLTLGSCFFVLTIESNGLNE
jgi:hypothetical protein